MENKSRNRYHRDNVNVPMGPRIGNEGAHAEKRGNFLDAKAERQPLADEIMNAYAKRQREDYSEHEFPNEGSIDENSGVRRYAAGKRKYRD
jgi:hypothetical protein